VVVKSTLHGLRITEVPTILSPDGRSRPPHLRSWRDGWRHLRFLLIFSPRWLFFYPGISMFLLGLALMAWIEPGTKFLFGVGLDIHTLVYASALTFVGLQTIFFAFFTKVHGVNLKLLPADPMMERMLRAASLERGLVLGLLLLAGGFAGTVHAVTSWYGAAFGPQQPQELMRLIIPSVTALTCGVQLIFASFFLSVLRLGHVPSSTAASSD
jgi:hypothetical protein